VRRDLALLACLCLAPGKGVPPRWPKSALTVAREKGGGFKVKLWDKEVEAGGLALTLLYWHTWRERLDRPEQRRMYHKAWAYSDLLFPASNGGPLTKHAVRNALLRVTAGGDGPAGLTPGVIRKAFMQLEHVDLRAGRLGRERGHRAEMAPSFSRIVPQNSPKFACEVGEGTSVVGLSFMEKTEKGGGYAASEGWFYTQGRSGALARRSSSRRRRLERLIWVFCKIDSKLPS
jgi:hypothetical protein